MGMAGPKNLSHCVLLSRLHISKTLESKWSWDLNLAIPAWEGCGYPKQCPSCCTKYHSLDIFYVFSQTWLLEWYGCLFEKNIEFYN